LGLKIVGRELFRAGAALMSGIGGHAREAARCGVGRQWGYLAS
jgi:hypothetical protein